MSTEGQNIRDAVRQVRGLFRQVALLLSTADALMSEAGWEPGAGSTAAAGGSNSIEWPNWWIPPAAFRFYRHPSWGNLLAFVSVIFDDIDNPGWVDEPLVSAGWHDYGKGKAVDEWQFEYCRWHLEMPGRRDDGELVSTNPTKEWPREKYTVTKTATLALPLVAVRDSECLRQMVVEKLLRALAAEGYAVSPPSKAPGA